MSEFIKRLIWYIYVRDLWEIVLYIVVAVVIWRAAGSAIKDELRSKWRSLNCGLSVLFVLAIFTVTVFLRTESSTEVVLMPFHGFIEAKTQPEMYRSMLMNVFLFVPFGMFLPFALPKKRGKTGKNILLTVLVAAAISVTIEAIQYIFMLGRCETDDVICNSLGAFIGSLAYTGKKS